MAATSKSSSKRSPVMSKAAVLERKLLKRRYGVRFVGIVKAESERLGLSIDQTVRVLCAEWLASNVMYLFSEPKDIEALMQARTFE